ncbi:tRNA (adenosine(37)-N6)-dimethylallyltransferase MiaA [Candidatus Peribacteria bacterium RIFCSPHIGHO2_01_FULL_51_9]|nr:MAG: tRNA (adenosine(37)-N6)-dimethylallyltransferase MiaA [Candidatus Peribacteria bacterium RIFCSPHIGHO2_01_FULL_51_9]
MLNKFIATSSQPLIVILGPTGSGKTDFSIRLARALEKEGKKPEIVSADSRQLYRFLDIGTAKIRNEEMYGIPHHLFSVLDPREEVTVAWYREKALAMIDEILARGSCPILVGGSMLYLSAIIDGLELLPSADPAVRSRLEEEYEKDRGISLHLRLQEVDSESAVSIHPNNKPYIIRAMEIYESSGGIPSQEKKKSHCPYNLFIVGTHWSREALVRMINERTERLLRSGWIAEVQSLLQRGYSVDDPGMNSLGYREIGEGLRRGLGEAEIVKQYGEVIAAKTRQYAKRQMTWWKNDERIRWVNYEGSTHAISNS